MMELLGGLRSVELGGVAGAWRELVMRLDVASATGPRHAFRRLAQDIRHARGNMLNRAGAEEMWASAATTLGAKLVGVGDGFFEITKDGARTRVYEQIAPLNDDVAVRLADDKSLVYRLLGTEGVPIPEHLEFSLREFSHAVDFLEVARAPCVGKPARGGAQGFGVTSQVQKPADLRR